MREASRPSQSFLVDLPIKKMIAMMQINVRMKGITRICRIFGRRMGISRRNPAAYRKPRRSAARTGRKTHHFEVPITAC
jgi:hypothetical protein